MLVQRSWLWHGVLKWIWEKLNSVRKQFDLFIYLFIFGTSLFQGYSSSTSVQIGAQNTYKLKPYSTKVYKLQQYWTVKMTIYHISYYWNWKVKFPSYNHDTVVVLECTTHNTTHNIVLWFFRQFLKAALSQQNVIIVLLLNGQQEVELMTTIM